MIEMINVNYSYGNTIALRDINIKINRGESIALIGPNGSGKSTLLKVINGLALPQAGDYFFNSKKITSKLLKDNMFSKDFHKKIGFVFQNSEVQLFCTSVYDEVAFGPMQMDIDNSKINKRVNDILELLKIKELQNRNPLYLSGGEKKKVAIASVIVLNPEVLVLDEPMNGLDPKTKKFLRELIIKLNEAGKTIICSTHDFEYVEGIFKRAIVFSEEHTIIYDGEYQSIINDKEFLQNNNII